MSAEPPAMRAGCLVVSYGALLEQSSLPDMSKEAVAVGQAWAEEHGLLLGEEDRLTVQVCRLDHCIKIFARVMHELWKVRKTCNGLCSPKSSLLNSVAMELPSLHVHGWAPLTYAASHCIRECQCDLQPERREAVISVCGASLYR